jgi:uncharacterized protein (DUF302 family)
MDVDDASLTPAEAIVVTAPPAATPALSDSNAIVWVGPS